MAVTLKLEGVTWRGGRSRAQVEGLGTGGVFRNSGPDPVLHSASSDMSSPTTVAAGADSGTITTRRWLQTTGRATLNFRGEQVGTDCLLPVDDPRYQV